MVKKQGIDMTRGSPGKLILRFAVPMILGNVVQQLYSAVDSAVVGRYVGKNALAAVGATQSVLMLIICLIIGLTMGVCIIMAQDFGAGREEEVRHTAGTALYISFGTWLFIAALGWLISGPVLALLGTPAEIAADAKCYLIINTATSLAPIAYNMTANIMRAMGDSKSPLYSVICSSVLNVILDLVFVIQFNWGVAGVAWATALSQVASCGINLMRIRLVHPILRLGREDLRLRPAGIVRIVRVGLPMALQNAVESIGMLGVQGVVNSCGTNTIAAFTAAGKIDQIALFPLSSLGMSVSTYVGQNYGKGNEKRIRKGVRAGVAQSVAIGTALTAVIFSTRHLLVGIFVSAKETEVLAIAAEYLGTVSLYYAVAGVMFVYLNAFRGMGNMTVSTAGSCLNPLLKFAAAALFVRLFGRDGIWFAWPVGWAASLALSLLFYHRRRAQGNAKEKENLYD